MRSATVLLDTLGFSGFNTVMQAVEQVVLETDRQALFARVAATLGRVL